MRAEIPVVLAVNRKTGTYTALAHAIDGVWRGQLRLPRGMFFQKALPSILIVGVERSGFALEHDAVALLTLPALKLTHPFLIPPNLVRRLELKRTARSFDLVAICTDTRTVTLKEARRSSRRGSLPPGIHNPAALFVTDGVKAHTVQGGLPSLGKRR